MPNLTWLSSFPKVPASEKALLRAKEEEIHELKVQLDALTNQRKQEIRNIGTTSPIQSQEVGGRGMLRTTTVADTALTVGGRARGNGVQARQALRAAFPA